MSVLELQAEIGMKMLELGNCIDKGMPYAFIKKIYEELKQLQFDLATTERPLKEDSSEIVLE